MLGARIAALRRELGYSQAELARRLGVSPSAVGMYEQDRREPAAQILVSLAAVLGVSTDYLLTGCPGPTEEQSIVRILERRLDEAEQRLHRRGDPFSRQELAVLLSAILTNQL
ncbi:MAG: helix-turn-helix transcriptional regulator [Oscillospiraceae bacterium]|nr:helix-turn-helix transcriptional regulator [Oscillospiraceae bacterium]